VGGRSAGELNWRAARRCDIGNCVEIGTLGEFVLVRSSADPDGTHISLSRGEWEAFVAWVKDGHFDGL